MEGGWVGGGVGGGVMESRLIPLHSAGLLNARVCERERICECELVARIEPVGPAGRKKAKMVGLADQKKMKAKMLLVDR